MRVKLPQVLVSVVVIGFAHLIHAQGNPPVITGTSVGGVGYVTSTSGPNGISALIGQWGIPYPYGQNGPPLPGAEPAGQSIFTIDVDVNDGGMVNFSYSLETWDGGVYDWLDIYIVTPNGTVPLVSNLGQPIGFNWGTFWQSPNVSIAQSLDAWKNEHVQFVFSVEQDGYGDQTAAVLTNFAIQTCPIPPLTNPPFSDPEAASFEAGQTIDIVHLTVPMQTAWACFHTALGPNGTLTSAYRPSEYQSHLREVWDKWNPPGDLKDNSTPGCQALKNTVQTELFKHQLQNLQKRPAGPNGPHTQGLAIDVSTNIGNVDAVAGGCQLYRPFPVTDHVHFQHQQ